MGTVVTECAVVPGCSGTAEPAVVTVVATGGGDVGGVSEPVHEAKIRTAVNHACWIENALWVSFILFTDVSGEISTDS
jgi:hypothetical protein